MSPKIWWEDMAYQICTYLHAFRNNYKDLLDISRRPSLANLNVGVLILHELMAIILFLFMKPGTLENIIDFYGTTVHYGSLTGFTTN
jgi:hypothetical protein